MGVGNFYLNNAHTVYVPDESIYGNPEDGEENDRPEFFFYDLIDEIKNLIPTTFVPCSNQLKEYQDDCLIIAESGLFVLTVKSWDGYVALNLAIKDSVSEGAQSGLAEYQHWPTAKKIFDKLAEIYPLRVRGCAWTSGDYIVENSQVA